MTYPEQKLATAVISLALNDYVKSGTPDHEDYLFLTGQTPISKLWFQIADINPINHNRLAALRGGKHLA